MLEIHPIVRKTAKQNTIKAHRQDAQNVTRPTGPLLLKLYFLQFSLAGSPRKPLKPFTTLARGACQPPITTPICVARDQPPDPRLSCCLIGAVAAVDAATLVATGCCRRSFYVHRPSLRRRPRSVCSWSNPTITTEGGRSGGGGGGGGRRGQGSQHSGTLRTAAVLEGQHVEELAQADRVHGRALEGGLPRHMRQKGRKQQRGRWYGTLACSEIAKSPLPGTAFHPGLDVVLVPDVC